MLLVGRNAPRLQAAKDELGSRYPALAVATLSGDITDPATRQQICAAACAFPQPLNLLINNAGINEFRAFATQESSAIEKLIAVNLLAPMLLTQQLLPALKEAKQAQIVNIGSVLGFMGYPGNCAYCAAKFGLRGFSQALRRELADTGIAVRYVSPRATKTALNAAAVTGLNHALKVKEDAPELVAAMFLRFLRGRAFEMRLGFPERLYIFLNQLAPWINDNAIRKQLPVIRKYLPTSGSNI
jgi:short-subunit dehydrogenase